MTNYERIHSMTADELAEFIGYASSTFIPCDFCKYRDINCLDADSMNCVEGYKDWLNQEVEE